MEDQVVCPRCRSTQIHAEKRGFRLSTGFIGSGKIFITCLKCGHRFRPGSSSAGNFGCGTIALVVFALVVLMHACS